ncbi:MAG: putative sterol carrier protein [Flammeovirgaceae bacterium]|jgi:putative sterol carrier protein
MTLEEVTKKIEENAQKVDGIEATVKFVLDSGTVYVDGNGSHNTVTNDSKEADCEVEVSTENLEAMIKGELNPMMAFMNQQMKIDGDMTVAMKLASLFAEE